MRYSVYNKSMRKLVYETDNLSEAENYARKFMTKSRKHTIYDAELKTFNIQRIRKGN